MIDHDYGGGGWGGELSNTWAGRNTAGTGLIARDRSAARHPPAGTVWDQLDRHQVSWRNYFVELPEIGLYPHVLLGHLGNAKPDGPLWTTPACDRLWSHHEVGELAIRAGSYLLRQVCAAGP